MERLADLAALSSGKKRFRCQNPTSHQFEYWIFFAGRTQCKCSNSKLTSPNPRTCNSVLTFIPHWRLGRLSNTVSMFGTEIITHGPKRKRLKSTRTSGSERDWG